MTLCIEMTEIYNSWIQTLILAAMVVTFIIYYYQLRAMKAASKGQNMLSIINLLQDNDVRKARKSVLEKLKNVEYNKWDNDDKEAASKVCSTYDTVGILVYQQKIVSEDSFLESWGPSIKECYETLEPHIKFMQENKSSLKYWKHFNTLYLKFKDRE